jgi:sirohydrochlorin ferrochelatase
MRDRRSGIRTPWHPTVLSPAATPGVPGAAALTSRRVRTDDPSGRGSVPSGPVLVACGHGTRDPVGRRVLAELRLDVARARPGLQVVTASVDVQKPALSAVVARLSAEGRASVVVPLLLSAGYHVRVDVTGAVASSGGLATAAAALGPDPALVDVLVDRLAEAGAAPDVPVVLAAAGSSDPRALADVDAVADLLAARREGRVRAAFLSAATPGVADAVAELRTESPPGTQVAVATYLLAPGDFSRRLAGVGADLVTAPLAPHPLLAELVLRRYDEALT